MKKLLPYILILVALIGFFTPIMNIYAQDTGVCRYKHDGAFGQKAGDVVTYVPGHGNTPEQQCGLSAEAEWIQSGSTTSSTPITAYQKCIDDGGNYEQCKNLSGRPATSPTSTDGITTGPVNQNYRLLIPLPCGDIDSDECSGGQFGAFNPAEKNALGTYLNIIIQIGIGLAAVLAVVMIVIGGLEYMTSELISSKEAGKERITQAILGLLLALGSYAILFTINPDLLNTDLESLTDVTVEVDLVADAPQTYDPTTKKYPSGVLFGADWVALSGSATPSIQGVPWLSTNAPECAKVGDTGCTSTRGLGLSSLIQIHDNCPNPCPLIITGGTEFWLHGGQTGSTSHNKGSSTVDLRPNPNLDKYLSGGKPLVKNQRYPTPKTGAYLWEGDHWHVGR